MNRRCSFAHYLIFHFFSVSQFLYGINVATATDVITAVILPVFESLFKIKFEELKSYMVTWYIIYLQ